MCYFIENVLSKMKFRKQGGNWTNTFEPGLQERDLFPLHRYVTVHAEATHSSTRHDMKFRTPSNRERRFKVWIPGDEYDGTGVRQTPGVHPSEQKSAEDGQRVGCGYLFFPYNSRLVADVSMPYYPFDCRLLVRTGLYSITCVYAERHRFFYCYL